MEHQLSGITPKTLRGYFHDGSLVLPTAGLCPDYVQANLVILPREYAEDFIAFLKKNPKPCPVLEFIQGEKPISKTVAPGSDISKDFPLYWVYRNGAMTQEATDISYLWEPNMIAALIGCSLTFDSKLTEAGIRLAHYEQNRRVPMYRTNIPCVPAGVFQGTYVVSMRPIPNNSIQFATELTERMEYAHGGPVHVGEPAEIGIQDINCPDFGDPLNIGPGETPMFWACGVTAQVVAASAVPRIMIAHSPGYMLVTDLRLDQLGTGKA